MYLDRTYRQMYEDVNPPQPVHSPAGSPGEATDEHQRDSHQIGSWQNWTQGNQKKFFDNLFNWH